YRLRTDAGLDRTQALPFPDFVYAWCNSPAPFEAVHRLALQVTTEALQGLPEQSPAAYEKAVERVLRSWRADPAVAGANQALVLLDDVARKSGILFARSAAGRTAPVVDGNITPGEWGEPVYEGAFYVAYTMEHSPHRTKIYAQERDGQTLDLAFDCEGDPAVIGADVTGRNTDTQYPRRMIKDDAIAINIKAPGVPYLAYAFNVSGAASAPDVIRSAARKTAHGWQLEVSIPLAECASPIAKTGRLAVDDAQFCISRYERMPTGDGKGTTAQCTTIRPVGRVGTTVGDGNHDSLMAFVWGLTVLYEKAGK
ncbi:MAG: hypothetical protein WCP21_17645, partial [Armatimonadota bacterium]